MEMDLLPCGYKLVSGGKDESEAMENEIDELKHQIETLEEENTSLKKELENQEALVTALDDIQHYLDMIRDVFHDLNKKDIYRNNF